MLTIAVAANDRTLPLMAGLESIEGVDAEFVTEPLEKIFATAFDEARYDVSELSFSNFLYLTSLGDCPYVGLPVFPSRAFRHSAIYIRDDRGIHSPRDLAGKLIGVREYSMTAALVARGVLEDEFGVRSQDARWCYGRADSKDTHPIARLSPHGIDIDRIADVDTLSDLLADGRIDAMVAYKPPPAYLEGAAHVRRLFENYPAVERDYMRRTEHFPIMHLIGVRREILADAPELALKLCNGFERARRYSQDRHLEMQASYSMLPWNAFDAEELEEEFGHSIWQYGVSENATAIEKLCRYSLAQGIAERELTDSELFAPETLDWRPLGAVL